MAYQYLMAHQTEIRQMKRLALSAGFAALLAAGWMIGSQTASRAAEGPVSGNGKLKFRVLYTSSHLPQEAQKVLKGAHGGFAIDGRAGKGETYFSLKGAGIIQISSDLKKTKMMATPPEAAKTNLHNTNLYRASDGKMYFILPGNEAQQVFITTMDGKLVQSLPKPADGTDLGNETANNYFKQGGNFIPTDVDVLDDLMYIPTGYSKLDYVLTAKIQSTSPFKAVWNDLAFGGRGTGQGQFGTGHGITVPPGTKRIDVADRPNSEIERFTRYGHYLSTVKLPLGSFPCDIQYLGSRAIVGALHGPDRSKGAPIYILENDEVVSTIMAKEELGLKNFQHIHNAVLREVGGKLYVIAQAWNPGDFAILEQVAD
jgi:hypothetical protein